MTDLAVETPTETPATPETPAETPAAAPPKPGRGAALPPTPAPPAERPGKKRGRPSKADMAARASAPPATPAPTATVEGPPAWEDPAKLASAAPVAESAAMCVHIVTVARGGQGLDETTAPMLAGALAPLVVKYDGASLGPEIGAALALVVCGAAATAPASEALKLDPNWRPRSPRELFAAMRRGTPVRLDE